mmetsp:Transcript_80902/g.229177  ORF Transcript_80902/g.229177 Transcript_80902/m.229177 type:complete len:213 (+) Transcript_80902:190-828(+)
MLLSSSSAATSASCRSCSAPSADPTSSAKAFWPSSPAPALRRLSAKSSTIFASCGLYSSSSPHIRSRQPCSTSCWLISLSCRELALAQAHAASFFTSWLSPGSSLPQRTGRRPLPITACACSRVPAMTLETSQHASFLTPLSAWLSRSSTGPSTPQSRIACVCCVSPVAMLPAQRSAASVVSSASPRRSSTTREQTPRSSTAWMHSSGPSER